MRKCEVLYVCDALHSFVSVGWDKAVCLWDTESAKVLVRIQFQFVYLIWYMNVDRELNIVVVVVY